MNKSKVSGIGSYKKYITSFLGHVKEIFKQINQNREPTVITSAYITKWWIITTTLGWLIGFVLVILLALAADALGGGVQVIVGIGMGAGVGFAQGWFLRRWLDSPWPWMWVSTIGMGMPFLFLDLTHLFGMNLPNSLWIYVPIGGLVVAFFQSKLLHRITDDTWPWIFYSVLGWTLPVLLMAVGDEFKSLGVFGGFLSIGVMFLGGVLLGAVTVKAIKLYIQEPKI